MVKTPAIPKSKSRAEQDSAECIYKKKWTPRPNSTGSKASGMPDGALQPKALSAEDDAKLIFGTVFSLRNMIRKLGGLDDKYTSPHPCVVHESS